MVPPCQRIEVRDVAAEPRLLVRPVHLQPPADSRLRSRGARCGTQSVGRTKRHAICPVVSGVASDCGR
jgi:hypothetical protein